MSDGAKKSKEGTYDRRFERVAHWLLARGVRPNHFTFAQIPVFAAMIWSALSGQTWWFFGLSWFVILLDGGDGILARVGNLQSRTGAILDASFDTFGIAVVLGGAAQFFPEVGALLWTLFVLNGLLFLQNALLGAKVVSYVRGPVLVGVAWPEAMFGSLVVVYVIVLWLLVAKTPATLRHVAALRTRPA